tara:strand:- start:247 stop:1092 length:846 start_codon:yes stop_codon:yes gene_type:complete
MSSKISTLLDDIGYRLEEGTVPEEANLAIFLDELKEVMQNFFVEESNRDSTGKLRLSAVGREDRKLWYDYKGYGKEKLTTDLKIRFCLGHILEAFVLLLAREAGHTVEDCQKEVTVSGVKGHIDCLIDGELVDVKSASPYGFKKFVDGSLVHGDDPFGYMYQLSSYGAALGKERGYFLAIDKSGGGMTLLNVPLDTVDPAERINYLKDTLPDDEPPPKCYPEVEEASGNRKLGFNCKFCDFKVECWKDSNNGAGLRKYNYSRGPEYFTHVSKEPRVEEDFF